MRKYPQGTFQKKKKNAFLDPMTFLHSVYSVHSAIICNHFQKFQKFKDSSLFWWPKIIALKNGIALNYLDDLSILDYHNLNKDLTPILPLLF